MPLVPVEQTTIEQAIRQALKDVSLPNPFHLKAGLRVLMTTNFISFEKIASQTVQNDLVYFKKILQNPEILAPLSCKTEAGREETLNFIKKYTLENLYLLDGRTSILPNTTMIQKSIMEGERLKSVVHSSALRNVVTRAHYMDSLEKNLRESGLSAEKIKDIVQNAIDGTQNLHKAVEAGNISDVLKSLAIHGVDVNCPDQLGMAPLHIAAREGYAETVKLLLTVPDIDVNMAGNNGWTSLHIAARMGHADVVDALLTMPKVEVNSVNSDGWGALHWAAWHGFTEVVTVLLTSPGINANLKDKNGVTPLHLAARNGHPDVITVLISVPKIEINPIDNEKRTPLHEATTYNHAGAVKALLAASEITVNMADMDGFTPLHSAARNGNAEITKALLAHKDILTTELDNNNMTPLEWARRNGHREIIQLLTPRRLGPAPKISLVDKILRALKLT